MNYLYTWNNESETLIYLCAIWGGIGIPRPGIPPPPPETAALGPNRILKIKIVKILNFKVVKKQINSSFLF